MAKPKTKVLVEVISTHHISVWVDDKTAAARDILTIEGVITTFSHSCLAIYTDPRYDTEEIADEIRQLLAAEVPDVFKEDGSE